MGWNASGYGTMRFAPVKVCASSMRFVKSDPGAFWEIDVDGAVVSIAHGSAGAAVHRESFECRNAGAARKEAARRQSEKAAAGYVRVPCYEQEKKFWEIERLGAELVIRSGRIGARPKITRLRLADAANAQADLEKRVRKKLAAGYREA